MKIYNKKAFAQGMLLAALAAALAYICFTKDFSAKNAALALFCGAFAAYFLPRSLSREKSREDKREELEERNQYIALKSNGKSHQITQVGSETIMILFLAMGKVCGSREFLGIGIGAASCFAVSLFAELFTKLYYEKRN